MTEPRRAVFLDRDGVVNVDRGYVRKPSDFTLVAGAAQAISMLNANDYLVFLVTNQSGIGRGFFTEEDYLVVTEHMTSLLRQQNARIDDMRHCPFHPDARVPRYRAEHPWRKPAPGMILDLLDQWNVDADASFLIGDSATDIEAANAAGIPGYLFNGGNLLGFLRAVEPTLRGNST